MKQTKTKSALITSALAMLICVALLVGTTFAWFTDTASTGVNKIQAGNLDIEIVDMGENTIADLKWVADDGRAQDEILWEPGATYKLEQFKIKNNGNLALKFKFVIEGLSGDAKLLEAIDFTYTDDQKNTFDVTQEYTLRAGDATAPITITGKMKDTAGNEYQGLNLDSISITVVATQAPVEFDSISDQYDAQAVYPVVLPGEVTFSGTNTEIFTETSRIHGNYASERFAAAGLECVVDVYESTVPDTAAFKLTLEEVTEQEADFIVTNGDGSKTYVKLVLEGYTAGPTDPEISLQIIGATEIAEGTNSTYSFGYVYTGTNAEGEEFACVAGISKK